MQFENPRSLRSTQKERGRKRRQKLGEMTAVPLGHRRNDLCPRIELVHRNPSDLTIPARNVRTVDEAQLARVIHSIEAAGFIMPVLIDQDGKIIDGVISVTAAKKLNLPSIPCVQASHLNKSEKRALRLRLKSSAGKGQLVAGRVKG